MENSEAPKSSEAIAQEAKSLYGEHKTLSELRKTSLAQFRSSTTPEDRKITGDLFGNVAGLNNDHIIAAKEFYKNNEGELQDLAMQEAVAAGKDIIEFEEKAEQTFSLEDLRKNLLSVPGAEGLVEARLQIVEKYCKDHGITEMTIVDILAIRRLPEWKNAG